MPVNINKLTYYIRNNNLVPTWILFSHATNFPIP